jgi:hypothetical protein
MGNDVIIMLTLILHPALIMGKAVIIMQTLTLHPALIMIRL